MYKPITLLHGEHSEWMGKLSFYNDDLVVMRKRLDDVVKRNNSNEFLTSLEHFKNQIVAQQDQIDQLMHEINEHEDVLENILSHRPAASDHRKMNDHPEHREKIARFEELFRTMRKEQMIFLAKWM
jgi:hypothetical protein